MNIARRHPDTGRRGHSAGAAGAWGSDGGRAAWDSPGASAPTC